jgi:lipid-A-disaccharide synthase
VPGPTILLSAGEPSGDLHGAAVAHALKRRWPGAKLFGLGGPLMAEAGVELLADPAKLAVMGFAEVIGRLPFFWRLFRQVEAEMKARGVDLVVPIDDPGFNLRLARSARGAGIPVLYYIAPQVWAWHRSRIHRFAVDTDRVAVVFPFEEPLFREAGVSATFVGHPLLDLPEPGSRRSLCRELNLEEERPILALFPGSRAQEVRRHLAIFVETAIRLQAYRPALQPVIAVSSAVPQRMYHGLPLPRTSNSRDLLWHAHAALVKSGTTTLEAALSETPMAIVYRTHPLTYRLAKRLVQVDHIGLVNLVAGERLVPEFIQEDATPAALSAALLPLIQASHPDRDRALAGLAKTRSRLVAPGTEDRRVADRVVELAAELIPAAR